MSATHEADQDLCVVHTSQPILSAENLADFQRFMGELDRAGRESHFWQMWGAVWEVCHLPVPDEVLTHLSLGGRQVPLRRFVCVAPECRRCNQGVGGFQFPFLGPWRHKQNAIKIVHRSRILRCVLGGEGASRPLTPTPHPR